MVPSWWVTDLLLFMATFISERAVGAQTILRGFGTILAVVPFSFSCASGYFIGAAIGEKDLDQIKNYYRVSICFSVGLGAAFCVLLLLTKPYLIAMYTDKSEIAEEMEIVWPVLAIYAVFDCF